MLRRRAIIAHNYAADFPQSLPLDRFIQGTLVASLGVDRSEATLTGARWAGFAASVATAILAARALPAAGARGLASMPAVLALAGGGYLCIFTGFARDSVEMLPLVLLLLSGLRARASDRGRLSPIPEVALSTLLLLHRSALCLLPCYLVATIPRVRARRPSDRGRAVWLGGVLLLLVVALAIAPRYASVFSTFDLPNHAGWLTAPGAPRPPIADPRSLWDALNALLLLAPIAPIAWWGVAGSRGTREGQVLASALLGWLPLLFASPQQGLFRDYDVYAGFALTLAFVAAIGLGRLAASGRRMDRALVALAAISTLQSSLGILSVSSDVAATEARVRHGLERTDRRWPGEEAGMLEYLALNAEIRGDWSSAARELAAAADLIPSPLRLVATGRAVAHAGDWHAAERWFARLTERDPTNELGWCGRAAALRALGDTLRAASAEERLVELCRSPIRAQVAWAFLASTPILDPSGALRAKIVGGL